MGFKMVRDNQQAWAKAHGVSGQWRKSPDAVAALGRKLGEEVMEYLENGDIGELFDLEDVLNELGDTLYHSRYEDYCRALTRHNLKVQRSGRFADHIEWSPVPAEHEKDVL